MMSAFYILPALGWGLMPVISKKTGGKPQEQLLGTTLAALLISGCIALFVPIHYNLQGFVVSFISGLFWAAGQFLQFGALEKEEVSRVMPFSNGTQLIFTTLASGLILQEWLGIKQATLSVLMLLIVVLAIQLLTHKEGIEAKKLEMATLIMIIESSLCLMGYATITSFFHISGLAIFLPQAMGMCTGAMIILLLKKESLSKKAILYNLSTGCSWSIANLSLFYTASKLGMGLSYTISQLCIFVSVIGGMIFLKEKKNALEIGRMSLGVILFFGAILGLSYFK